MGMNGFVADRFKNLVCPFVRDISPLVCTSYALNIPLVNSNRPFIRISSRESGFTLIELLITLVVAAVLLGVAVPNFRTFIQNSRVTTQSNEMLAHLAVARSEAIKRNAPVVVCPSAVPTAAAPSCTAGGTWETGWLVFEDAVDPVTKKGNNTFATAEGDILLRIHERLEGNNTLRANGAELAKPLTFGSSGVTTMAAADFFKLCDARGTSFARAIMVEATGRARIARATQVAFSCP